MAGILHTSGRLFEENAEREVEMLAEGAVLLRRFAAPESSRLLEELEGVTRVSPFRHMVVRGGRKMSVAMTNCGEWGWMSDESGYRYARTDVLSGRAWPGMPQVFSELARRAAARAGFGDFDADACLVNRYAPGAQMGLHQDRDERDFEKPIVSVSLGLPAIFLFGGTRRSDRPKRYPLESGDVVVFGGAGRLAYHGVAKLADGEHPLTGKYRINLTFRRAY